MAFVAPVAAAIGGFAASAAPFVGLATSAMGLFGGHQKAPSMPATAPPPSYAETQATEQKRLLTAAQGQTKNILTSPLGVENSKPSQKKLLLGA